MATKVYTQVVKRLHAPARASSRAQRTRLTVTAYPECSIPTGKNQDLSRRFVRVTRAAFFAARQYAAVATGRIRSGVDEPMQRIASEAPISPRQALDETRLINYRGGRTGPEMGAFRGRGVGCTALCSGCDRNRCRTPHRREPEQRRRARKQALRCPPPFPTSGNGSEKVRCNV